MKLSPDQEALRVCLAYIQKKLHPPNPDGLGVGTIHFTSVKGIKMELKFSEWARALLNKRNRK